MKNLPNFIVNGVCKKDEKGICNIGYACDGCPYNKEKPIQEKKECYCCKKIKEGTVKIVVLNVRGTGENKVTEAETRFVCHSCNHLKLKNKQEKPHEI